MIAAIIKYLSIYFFTIYMCKKSICAQTILFTKAGILSILLSLMSCFLSTHFNSISTIIPILLLWLYLSRETSNPQLSFIATIVSFTTSFCVYAAANFIVIFLTYPILRHINQLPLAAFLTVIVQTLIIYKLFCIKRFKKGIPFLSSPNFINIATPVCLLFFTFMLYVSDQYTHPHLKLLSLCTFILVLTFLIYWWQAQITKSYRRRLELREQESLRTEVAELTLLVRKLSEDNERMARITHRDNTLITTLKNSTIQYLSTDFKNPAEAIAARDKLILNINALSQGRTTLTNNYGKKTSRVFDTGLSLLDALLRQMDSDALQQDIIFSVHNAVTLTDFVPSNVSEDDLVHTIDDMLKNAFKATKTLDRRMVQLQFYKLDKQLVVEVSDNGIPFEIRTFADMGIEKRTTYADGSGIGLMDIWSTKEKYRATYHIDEHKNPAPFSKKISIIFDKKNRYSIRSWRKDEIQKVSRRIDLQVYSDES